MSPTIYRILFTCLPHHLMSRAVGWLAHTRINWVKSAFIRWFIWQYQVDMREAAKPDPNAYPTFNDFFTRALADGARPLAAQADALICPVDGCVSELGRVEVGRLLQAKSEYYTVERLLADAERAKAFQSAAFATLYLAPKDYHRIHMPVTGTLTHMTYVPGRLFSVNDASVGAISELFARNERVIAYFDTQFGALAMVLVGAMIVASIQTQWAGVVAPGGRTVQHWAYPAGEVVLQKGDELGQFRLGSTVIMLLDNPEYQWADAMVPGAPVRLGQLVGTVV